MLRQYACLGHRHATIATWLTRAGEHSATFHDRTFRNLHLPHLQLEPGRGGSAPAARLEVVRWHASVKKRARISSDGQIGIIHHIRREYPGEVLLALLQETEGLTHGDTPYHPDAIRLYGFFVRVYLRLGDVEQARTGADRASGWIAKAQPTLFYPFEGYASAAEAYLELWRRSTEADPAQAPALKARARQACRSLQVFAGPFRFARPRAWLW